MGKLLKGGILGGLVLFIWGVISWTVLDWHTSTFENFPSEVVATEFINQVPKSGMYIQQSIDNQTQISVSNNSPLMFAAISKAGTQKSMLVHMGIALLMQIIAAMIVTGLVLIKPHIQFTGRLFQVLLFALAAAIVTYVPYMNWFNFSAHYTLVSIIDLLIGWLFAGLVISRLTKPKYPQFY